jgi:hypothetical protein
MNECRLIRIRLRVGEQREQHTYIIYNGPTNTLVCIKTLIQMSQTKTFKITLTCFDHQMIETR